MKVHYNNQRFGAWNRRTVPLVLTALAATLPVLGAQFPSTGNSTSEIAGADSGQPGTNSARIKSLRATDDERVAATITADKARLTAILSDDLRYSHSNGKLDTKSSFIQSQVDGGSRYLSIEYEQRHFTFPAPGIALMAGRARVKASSADGESDVRLVFLAVWREERGRWRFLAWQSCKLPPTEDKR